MAAAPHVRGEVRIRFATTICGGITPACAGRSPYWPFQQRLKPDHPRVRGEKGHRQFIHAARLGSPPRARGEVYMILFAFALDGITPACAGRSHSVFLPYSVSWDHPRVRGEKVISTPAPPRVAGSPPRARGEAEVKNLLANALRITPACAGRSVHQLIRLAFAKDHPRVRGEKLSSTSLTALAGGSPPRARGEA